jgi:hypothetical protein
VGILGFLCEIGASTKEIVVTGEICIETLLFILVNDFGFCFGSSMEEPHLFDQFSIIKLSK